MAKTSTKGTVAYYCGIGAESLVARHYQALGYVICDVRWRTRGCEIDLILRHDDTFVFVEVKAAKTWDAAKLRYSLAQQHRQIEAASEYLGKDEARMRCDARFDLALVDGSGRIEVLENVLV